MAQVIIGLGGNTGDRIKNLLLAGGLLVERVGRIVEFSPIIESEPWGFQSENCFLNQILIMETALSPSKVLEECLAIEQTLGRQRTVDYSDRRMDIDILFYDDLVIAEEGMIIPHPRLHERLFILMPLVHLRPDFIHPILGLSTKKMLESCSDTTKTNWYKADHSTVLLP